MRRKRDGLGVCWGGACRCWCLWRLLHQPGWRRPRLDLRGSAAANEEWPWAPSSLATDQKGRL